jgi:hypothetical protein
MDCRKAKYKSMDNIKVSHCPQELLLVPWVVVVVVVVAQANS